MKLFNKSNLKYILLAIIIILIFFLTAIKTKADQPVNPITYDFYNSNILDVNQETNPEYYNVKEQSQYNGNYIAYKSFDGNIEDEIDGDLGSGSNTLEISNYLGHNNTINSTAFGIGNDFRYHIHYFYHSIFYISSYFCFSNLDLTDQILIHLVEEGTGLGVTSAFYLTINGGNLLVVHGNGLGGWFSSPIETLFNNTWYHFSFFINCTSDTFDFYWNYKKVLDNKTFYNDRQYDYISSIAVRSVLSSSNEVSCYFDALDHSYSQDWSFFRSRIPESLEMGYLEVDKYEFDYDVNDFENDFYDWKEFGYIAGYNDVYIDSTNNIENEIYINSIYGQAYANGIKYPSIDSNAMVFNMSFSMEVLLDYTETFYHQIMFYDKSNISHYFSYILFDMQSEMVRIYDTNSESLVDWFSYFDNHNYLFNIYINYYDNILIYLVLDLENNDNYMYNCSFPQIYHYQESYGLSEIRIYNACYETIDVSELLVVYYSIGIYENGLSIIDFEDIYEFGLMSYEIEELWNSDNHNLLTIDSYNCFDLFAHNYYEYYLDGYKIQEIENQSSIKTINLADKTDNNNPKFSYECPYLIFRLYGNFTNFFEVKIDGIQITDNLDNYFYANYYYNNTDVDYNWFYCIDNRLYYNFNNNDTLGIMRISFNINDILLNNESLISYSSFISNNYSGHINLISYHLTETFDIFNNDSLIYSYQNITDTEHFTLSSISIEIEQNNLSSDNAIGYIQNINIYPDKSLFPEFDDIDYLESTFLEKMIETIIPLLFFMIPALILRTKFGFKSVLPFWILLTIVFLFTNFIPFWICFIIFLAIALMVINKEEEVVI